VSARRPLSVVGRLGLSLGLALALVSVPGTARALGKDGDDFDTSNYTLDLQQGPVVGGSRIVGLAGAYTPIAEGIAGLSYNPAAVAHRAPDSTGWFSMDVDGGFTLASSFIDLDYDNNGDDSFANDAVLFVTAGLGFKFGAGGVAVNAEYQLYQVEAGDEVLNVSVLRAHLMGGYALWDGELIAGIGLGGNNVDVAQTSGTQAERQVAGVTGPTAHVGLLWAPNYLPLRVGAGARFSIPQDQDPSCELPCKKAGDDFVIDEDDDGVPEIYLPKSIRLPSEIWGGVAFQFFRQFNQGWADPHEEPSEARRIERQIELAQEQRERQLPARISALVSAGMTPSEAEDQLDDEESERRGQEKSAVSKASAADRQFRLAPYESMPRARLLISAAVKITLPVTDGVGVDSFLQQQVERSGEHLTLGPHLGVETEAVPNYLILRSGSYLEPTRFAAGTHRWHGTGGVAVHVPLSLGWDAFGLLDEDTTYRLTGAIDVADRYFGWNAGFGFWK
jgi:hypothetical protein